ncbi:MAG: RusA family crossover junction endodeoxyribonuclease [bacterium]|nr:RusA family crossover junction endodeoxyribonuclease [bacterium]
MTTKTRARRKATARTSPAGSVITERASISYSIDVAGRWSLVLPLSPIPAARPRVTRSGVTFYPKRYADFRKMAERLLKEADRIGGPWEATANPVYTWTFFVLPRPKRPANVYPIGDLDNYEKAAWDSVSKHGGIVEDDKQFIKSTSTKRYAIGSEEAHIAMTIVEEPNFQENPEDVYDLPAEMRISIDEAGL